MWITLRTWPWFLLLGSVRPLIEAAKAAAAAAAAAAAQSTEADDELKAKFAALQEELDREQVLRQQFEMQARKLHAEKCELEKELAVETEGRVAAERERDVSAPTG